MSVLKQRRMRTTRFAAGLLAGLWPVIMLVSLPRAAWGDDLASGSPPDTAWIVDMGWRATTTLATEKWPLAGIGMEYLGLVRNPTAEGTFDLATSVIGYAAGDAPWAGALGGYVAYRNAFKDVELTYSTFYHQAEAENLAFTGVLSRERLDLKLALPDFDSRSRSFKINLRESDSRVSVGGSWTETGRGSLSQFEATSRYSFENLQTAPGHFASGVGTVFRERTEQGGQGLPFDPMTMTERTRRSESYNETFNGAAANQSIQRALSKETARQPMGTTSTPKVAAPAPIFTAPTRLPPSQLYNDETVKRPPSVFIPPPMPPRQEPATVAVGNQQFRPPPQVKGVLMEATVVEKKATDKADMKQMFGSDDRE